MQKVIQFILLCFISVSTIGQRTILIDGDFSDWDGLEPVFVDPSNDGQSNGIDFKRIWTFNDQRYIYFRFEIGKEINLQENNDFAIYIDYDHNINTGFKINGIGAELRYFFGERFGIVSQSGNTEFVNFVPVGLLVSPTVSGTEFEISIERSVFVNTIAFNADPKIRFRLEDNGFNGDEAPNDLSGIVYDLNLANVSTLPAVSLNRKDNTAFRFMTYNIENDQLFDPARRNEFERIFKALNPDIIALQEVRDFGSQSTMELIESFIPGPWFHKKHGFDIVTISRYPIQFSESIDGNAAFFINVDGKEILLVNCHLPCCENDNDRQVEVDIIMEYIRKLKEGNSNYQIDEGTPIIIAGDMNFVGDMNQPYTFKTGDIFSNGFYGPDFKPDWDESDLSVVDAYTTNTIGNFTWLNANGSFYPGKLDWIFYTDSEIHIENSLSLYTPGLTQQELENNNLESQDVIAASDHMPVIADFSYTLVGSENFIESQIKLFPNPVRSILYITEGNLKTVKIQVLTVEGQLIREINTGTTFNGSIDVDDLNPGMYYLIVQTEKGRIAKQFLKVN